MAGPEPGLLSRAIAQLTSGRVTAMPLLWRGAVALAACCGFAYVVSLPQEDFAPDQIIPRPTQSGEADTDARARPSENTSYPAIARRPLFYPTRAPWEPPPPPAEPPPPAAVAAPPTDYTLMGVIVSGTKRTALIKGREGKTIFLDEGQELDGWTLRQIAGNRLRFASGDAEYDMNLPKPSDGGR